MLAFLGVMIGKRLGANPGLWAAALAAGGALLIVVGAALDIV